MKTLRFAVGANWVGMMLLITFADIETINKVAEAVSILFVVCGLLCVLWVFLPKRILARCRQNNPEET